MTPDESALLAAIAAAPASDLPRLVYADFLDDHGQPVRAEFIRLQCEIAKLEVGPRAEVDRNWRLWKRQQDLLDDHLPELLGSASDLAHCRPRFERGLLAEVSLAGDDLYTHGRLLRALQPLPDVRVLGGWQTRIGSHPHSCPLVRDAVLSATDETPHPDFDAQYTCAPGHLFSSPRFPPWSRLRSLDLSGCECDGRMPYHFRLHADRLPALSELNLSNNLLTDNEVIGLLNLRLPQRLTRLVLDGNPLGDQSAFELADRLGKVASFRTLDFRRTRVTAAGQAALTAAFGSRCNLF